MKEDSGKSEKQAHKLGANRHDPARNPARQQDGHKQSKDVREDRGVRQSKLGKHKN